MDSVLIKKPTKFLLIVVSAIFIVLAFSFKAEAYRPTFKVSGGGDIVAGGGFGDDCSTSASYKFGGILAYARYLSGAGTTGSTSQYGALALGNIEGGGGGAPGLNYFGFGSYKGANSGTGSGYKQLNFANTSDWGGNFISNPSNNFCISDYFDELQNSPTALTANSLGVTGGQKIVTPSSGTTVAINGSSVIPGEVAAIFVNGNAWIRGDITYTGPFTEANAPKFVLVALGDIYVDPLVSNMAGWYIAQPGGGIGSGQFWSCHNGTDIPPSKTDVTNTCTSALTIKGAVIARHVNLLRAPSASDATNDTYAEKFDFTPEMVIGPSFTSSDAASSGFSVDSVQSLPPVY